MTENETRLTLVKAFRIPADMSALLTANRVPVVDVCQLALLTALSASGAPKSQVSDFAEAIAASRRPRRPAPPPVKRGPGRPRKVPAPVVFEAPRKRGRPRKCPLPQAIAA